MPPRIQLFERLRVARRANPSTATCSPLKCSLRSCRSARRFPPLSPSMRHASAPAPASAVWPSAAGRPELLSWIARQDMRGGSQLLEGHRSASWRGHGRHRKLKPALDRLGTSIRATGRRRQQGRHHPLVDGSLRLSDSSSAATGRSRRIALRIGPSSPDASRSCLRRVWLSWWPGALGVGLRAGCPVEGYQGHAGVGGVVRPQRPRPRRAHAGRARRS